MKELIRIFKCPECGKPVREIITFNEDGMICAMQAFCADDNEGDCLFGGAWPYNQRNIENCKERERRKQC